MNKTEGLFTVLSQKSAGRDIIELAVNAPAIAKTAKPGQFCMIKTSSCAHDPLLRRPLSINNVAGETIVFLYKVLGKGTKALASVRPGERLGIIGPLGQWFRPYKHEYRILVVGGMGTAPLYFLMQTLVERQKNGRTIFIAGGKTDIEIPSPIKELKKQHPDIQIVTEDGSLGRKGLVTGPLSELIGEMDSNNTIIATCGPWPMMKAVHELATRHNILCQVSLEAYMACGSGLCLGCAVPDNDGAYLHVCREGPVVDSRKVRWTR
jgi:dihydroorotate dehydrogenase electron transfer subunit